MIHDPNQATRPIIVCPDLRLKVKKRRSAHVPPQPSTSAGVVLGTLGTAMIYHQPNQHHPSLHAVLDAGYGPSLTDRILLTDHQGRECKAVPGLAAESIMARCET
ncbi:hypothetical protein AJ78_08940 [Emergomyces pasteurianus Ep9510]|uniref:Uncharacterized protein n=1 Tax=Emergomyces pasteurianus Ep9510 TaxID=1447872 RepID=A0A1J9P0M5_9EURO|nr:hypothetical protein AJ78_08940 [Emergomyces pasteurianus Ep9510]